MSYAGVESDREYAERRYGLTSRADAADRAAVARREGKRLVLNELDTLAEELASNNRISWQSAFCRLQDAIHLMKGRT